MSEHLPTTNTPSSGNQPDKAEKKVMRGSIALSLFVHGLILLLIGSIIVVPGVVKEMNHITAVPPPPADVPPPPPAMDIPPDINQEDPGGSPITDVQDKPAADSSTEASVDALTLVNPANSGPSLNAMPGASTVSLDAFAGGKGGSGGGTGTGIGKGTGTRTFFGSHENNSDGLEGRLYDLMRAKSGTPSDVAGDVGKHLKLLNKFLSTGFPDNYFSNYYSPSTRIYAPQIMIPLTPAVDGPKAFGVTNVQGIQWVIVYKGKFTVPDSGTFRFVAFGDNHIDVAIDKKHVLESSIYNGTLSSRDPAQKDYYNYSFKVNPAIKAGDNLHNGVFVGQFRCGLWIDLVAGRTYDIRILIGQCLHPTCGFWLLVQQKDHVYALTPEGSPILPLFKISNIQMPPLDIGIPPYDKNMNLGWKSVKSSP